MRRGVTLGAREPWPHACAAICGPTTVTSGIGCSEALELAPVMCNQVEHHPSLGQSGLLRLCDEHDAAPTAYSPLAQGQVSSDPVLAEIGRAHGKVARRSRSGGWSASRVTAVPKASSHESRVENFDIWDLELSDEERARIDSLPKDRRDFDPSWAPDWDS